MQKNIRDDSVIYTMGSGASYGAAYMESICIFMEMQWLDSSSIHTGEYLPRIDLRSQMQTARL